MNQKRLFGLILSGFITGIALFYLGYTQLLMASMNEFVNSKLLFIVVNALIVLGISSFRKSILKENGARLLLLFVMTLFLDLFYGLYYKEYAFATLPLFVIAYDLFTTNKPKLAGNRRK